MTTRRSFAGLLGGAALGGLSTGCSLLSRGSSGAKPSSSVSPGVDAATKSTLHVVDAMAGADNPRAIAVNRAFMRTYPNVAIQRTLASYAVAARAAHRGTAPDVIQVSPGEGGLGKLVGASALLPLDAYAKAYQWSKRFPAALLQLNSFGVDGHAAGTGSLFGLAQTAQYAGLYYLPARLMHYRVGPPKTWPDFLAALARIKRAGGLPLILGNKDAYPATYLYAMVLDQPLGPAGAQDLVFGRRGAFDSAPGRQSAQLLQDWVRTGLLPSNCNQISYLQSIAAFGGGTGAFLIGSSADADAVSTATQGAARFMAPPSGGAGKPRVTSGGQGAAWAITAGSKNADVAAAYLDFLTSASAADVLAGSGTFPIAAPDTTKPSSAAAGDVRDGWTDLVRHNAVVPLLDYATPTFYTTAASVLGDLLSGKASADQAVQSLQTDYASHLKRR
ncbi:MAG: extracellular solute-binding protein [Mycobacteriales bacterium]